MERFGLSRLDLMQMTWIELMMLFDATYEDGSSTPHEDVRYATEEDLLNWI